MDGIDGNDNYRGGAFLLWVSGVLLGIVITAAFFQPYCRDLRQRAQDLLESYTECRDELGNR